MANKVTEATNRSEVLFSFLPLVVWRPGAYRLTILLVNGMIDYVGLEAMWNTSDVQTWETVVVFELGAVVLAVSSELIDW